MAGKSGADVCEVRPTMMLFSLCVNTSKFQAEIVDFSLCKELYRKEL
jgi:hypothetical protein